MGVLPFIFLMFVRPKVTFTMFEDFRHITHLILTFLHPVLLVHSSFIYLLCFGLFMDLLIGQLREMTE